MMEFLVESNSKIYEISALVTKVDYTDKLNNGCSKLEFSYKDDDLKLENGSILSFKYDGANIFYGVVFKHGRNKRGEITVTAYDPLRYAKAKDTIESRNDTITTLVNKMCNHFGLNIGHLTDSRYVLPVSVQDNKTWLDIIYGAISDTLMNTGKWFCLRDEFGGVAVRDVEDLTMNLILGDKSLVYEFNYEKSIDEDFYNLIRIQDKNNRQFIESMDEGSINKYGLIQYFDVANESMNPSQIKTKADLLLSLYHSEAETLELNCLGDVSIRAGNSFYGQIEDIQLNKRLIVKSVNHKFIPVHTMSLEVMIYDRSD